MTTAPARLEERLREESEFPPAWNPSAGGPDVVTGVITRFTKAPLKRFGGECWVCWLKTSTGPLAIWCSSAVLAAEFKRTKPKVGERIGVRFLGWSDDRRYKRFRVVVEGRPEEEPDFDTWADAEDVEAGPYTREVLAPKPAPARAGGRPANRSEVDPFE